MPSSASFRPFDHKDHADEGIRAPSWIGAVCARRLLFYLDGEVKEEHRIGDVFYLLLT